jgi:hypothetical protein
MPRDLPSACWRQEYLVEEKEHGRRATTQRTALLEAQQEVRRLFQELVRQPWGDKGRPIRPVGNLVVTWWRPMRPFSSTLNYPA